MFDVGVKVFDYDKKVKKNRRRNENILNNLKMVK